MDLNIDRKQGHPRGIVACSVLAALFTASCDIAGQGRSPTTAIGMSAPAPLLQARAIDRTRLIPIVRIVDGAFVTMQMTGETSWSGTIEVAPNREYQLSIVWVERIDAGDRARELPLASLEAPVEVGPDGALFTVSSDDYDYSADADSDGISNFDERVAGSDPFPDDIQAEGAGGDEPNPIGSTDDDEAGVPVPVQGPVEEPEPTPGDVAPDMPPAGPDDALAPDPEPAPGITPDPSSVPIPEPAPEPTDPTPEDLPADDDDELPVDEDDDGSTDDTGDLPGNEPDDETVEADPITSSDADVLIRRIAQGDAPVIDGFDVAVGSDRFLIGEWANATQRDANGDQLLIDNLMVDRGTDEASGEAWRYWAAAHDGEYLYVLVVVDDDGRRWRDSPAVWNDDSIELFIDGDNSKSTTYGADDFQRLIPLTAPGETRRSIDTGIVNGFFSSQAQLSIDFATGPGVGPRGIRRPRFEQDVYELRVELASAGIVPGRPFGFELQVNDDDDGGNRDAKWGWAHPTRTDEDIDGTYLDPSLMGTALLE